MATASVAQENSSDVPPPPLEVMFPRLPDLKLPPGVEVFFGPGQAIEKRTILAIDSAKQEVLVNHYLLTNTRIMDALLRAFNRKCVVVVMLDAAPAVKDYRTFDILKQMRIPCLPQKRKNGGWNESKYIVIDRTLVLVSSCDLTNVAARNDNTLMVLDEPSFATTFYNHFISVAFNIQRESSQ